MNYKYVLGWVLLILGGSILVITLGTMLSNVASGMAYGGDLSFIFLAFLGGGMTISGILMIKHASTQSPRQISQYSPPNKTRILNSLKIFISYRRTDSEDITGRIYDRLTQQYGKDNIFKDVDNIPLGVDFRKHLDKAVGSCNVVIAVIGKNWLASQNEYGDKRLFVPDDFVRIEIESALNRNIPVIPVLVGGASIPKEGDLPETIKGLAYRNGIPVRPDPDFHKDMNRLISGIT